MLLFRWRLEAPGFLLVLGLVLLPTVVHGQALDALSVDALEARVADLFERSCARSGCHAGPVPQMDMDLTRAQFYASTVREPSRELPALLRVHPGRPDSSYLMMKIRGDEGIVGTPMPFTGDRLTADEIQTVAAWIRKLEGVDTARKQEAARAAEPFAFTGFRAVNLPTARMVDRGSFLFSISHRFLPTLTDGYDAFFGLDGSGIIFLTFGYAVTDDLLIALGRSNASDDVELLGRYRIARQARSGGWPLDLAVQANLNWITEQQGGEDRLRSEVVKASGQVILTRELAGRAGVAFVPGILINPDETADGDAPLVTLGLAGRVHLYDTLALVGEWVPIVSGYTETFTAGTFNRFDSWGGGLEITTGGHVFQIVLSNSVGLASDQYLRGGDLDGNPLDGHLRLGFNISRILNF